MKILRWSENIKCGIVSPENLSLTLKRPFNLRLGATVVLVRESEGRNISVWRNRVN